jgi:hypothetical protein
MLFYLFRICAIRSAAPTRNNQEVRISVHAQDGIPSSFSFRSDSVGKRINKQITTAITWGEETNGVERTSAPNDTSAHMFLSVFHLPKDRSIDCF